MDITKEQFKFLGGLFNYYNKIVFNNTLPDCLVRITRRESCHGYFAPNSWKSQEGGGPIHEIALNAQSMTREARAWHSTLMHEMVHQWCEVFGSGCRWDYHSKEWGAKMKSIGLFPSNTGRTGGAETGRNMTHYIIEGGPFERAFEALKKHGDDKVSLPFNPLERQLLSVVVVAPAKPSKSGKRASYTCNCPTTVWGKEGLHIYCFDCKSVFQMKPPPSTSP